MKFSYRSEKTHQEHILEGFYTKMIRGSEQLRTVLALYDQRPAEGLSSKL